MFRYVHTNISAKDHQRLIDFYKKVFQCKNYRIADLAVDNDV